MPTTRRRRTQAYRAPLSEPLERYWATGDLARADGGTWGPSTPGRWEAFTLTPEELAWRWSAVRDGFVADWLAAHPGTRPHAWWLHDATEPRGWITATGPRAPRIPDDWTAWRQTRGIQVEDATGNRAEVVESEPGYLARLGLLTSTERRRLPRGVFDPIMVAADAPDEIDDDDPPF